jgi:hypothetical protein
MSTKTMLLGGIAILLLLASSSKQGQTLIGGAQPAGKSGGARTYGPAAPLPAQAPSGSPGAQTQGATILGSLTTNIFANADKIGAAIGDVISAARATDTGDDGSEEPNISSPVPVLAQGVGSGASWLGFGPPEVFQSETPHFSDVFGQDSSLDMAVPDFKFIPEA